MAGDEEIRLKQNALPPMAELDRNSMEFATRLLTSPEAVEGFVAGLAARQSINAAIDGKNPQPIQEAPNDEPMRQAEARLESIRSGKINQYDDTVDDKGSLAKQTDALVAAGHDLSHLEWKGMTVSPEWSNKTLQGYVAGLYGGSPLPTTTAREFFVSGNEVPEAIVRRGSVPLSTVLITRNAMSFSRDFGLRDEIKRRFEGEITDIFDVSGKIEPPAPAIITIKPKPGDGEVALTGRGTEAEISERYQAETEIKVERRDTAEDMGEIAVEAAAAEQEGESEPDAGHAALPEAVGDPDAASVPEPLPDPVEPEPESEAPKEFERPELKTVFATGDSIGKALRDPEVHPDVQQEIRSIVRNWQEVTLARTIETTWDEIIAPRLGELDNALPGLEEEIRRLDGVADSIEKGLGRVAEAILEGNMEYLGAAVRNLNLSENMPLLEQASKDLVKNDGLARASRQLNTESEESDGMIRRSLVSSFEGELEEDSLDALAQKVGPLLDEGMDLTEAIAAIRQDMPDQSTYRWRQRQEDIRYVAAFARIAGNNDELSRPFTTLLIDLELFRDQMRHSRYDSAQALHIRDARVRPLREEITMIQRMAALTRMYREAA